MGRKGEKSSVKQVRDNVSRAGEECRVHYSSSVSSIAEARWYAGGW